MAFCSKIIFLAYPVVIHNIIILDYFREKFAMRILLLDVKKLIKYLFIIIAVIIAISALSITGMNTIGVFSSKKEIPIYYFDCNEKKAAITFDCAWGASDIPAILEALEQENVKATFFIVGQWAEKYPEEVKLIAEKGHDVANHSYSHLRMGALDREKIKSEILKCSEKLAALSGQKIELFRPPYGDYSNNVVGVARELGYYTIQWNIDSLDWRPGISREEIMNRITERIRPGSIILFHNDTHHTAKILPDIIAELKKKGYVFEPVSKLIIRDNYKIDHEGKQIRF
jgi:polysaccharide deacetylase family sporulation protein PdaB